MTNPLVAERQDSTTAYSGIGIVESAVDLHNGIANGSWVEGGLGLVGGGLETLSLVIDPIGTLVSYGVAWLMEHVKPLSDALDWLAGDGDTIASYAQTWRNVSQAIGTARTDFDTAVRTDTAAWTGTAGDAYRTQAAGQSEQLGAAATSADTVGTVVEVVGVLVGVVREVVRDLIADCVATLIARIPQWLAEIAATLGIATPHVVASAVALISKWVARISDVITKLVRSVNNLRPLLRNLDEIWDAIRTGLRGLLPGGPSSPSTPGSSSTPNGPTAPNPGAVTSPTVTPGGPSTPSTPGSGPAPVSSTPTVTPDTPGTTPGSTPGATPSAAGPSPTVTPGGTPDTTPGAIPGSTPSAASPSPAVSPGPTPGPTPGTTPGPVSPSVSPSVTPDGPVATTAQSSAPGAVVDAPTSPNTSPGAGTPGTSPGTTPGATPGGVSPTITPGTTPGTTADTPGSTPGGTPDQPGTGPNGGRPDGDTSQVDFGDRDPSDPYPTSQADPPFESKLDEVLDQHGLSREEFHDLASRPADNLTQEQARIVHDVRHAVELTPDTTVSKVLPEDVARDYLNNTTDGFNPNNVGGFFARQSDVADFNSPAGLYDGLALGYDKTPFTPGDERIFSIRFEAGDTGDFSIPFGGNTPGNSSMNDFGGGPSGINERPSFNPPPFTGTGFTGSGDHVVPEFTRNPNSQIPEGAAIYETNAAGQERVVGVYGGPDVGWIPVNGGVQ